jgi:hypothetical protein
MLAIVGGMLAVFGLYRLGQGRAATHFLADIFEPDTAALLESYLAMIFGALVAGLGLYIFFGEKS